MHGLAVEPLDPRLRHDPPMHDVIEIERASGGMSFEQLVIRSRYFQCDPTVMRKFPPMAVAHYRARQRPATGLVDKGVVGLPGARLGKEVIAAPHRMHGARPVVGGIVEDVDGGVAGAHHQHPLAPELLLRLHVMGVQDLAGEGTWIAGPIRMPMMAVGDHKPVIEPRLQLRLRSGCASARRSARPRSPEH